VGTCTLCHVREFGRRWLLVVAGFVCGAAIAACGTTQAPARKRAEPPLAEQFQTAGLLDASANPEPAVYAYTGGAGPIDWSMCAPGASKCKPLPVTNGMADPGAQPAGTVFKLTATSGSKTYSRSFRWRGALRVERAPTLTGTARVGATVHVGAALWAGGWGTEHDDLGIEACRTARGTHCVMLTGAALACSAAGCGELGGVVREPTAPTYARVGNWYTGWYLFALDAHFGNPTSLIIGYSSPAAIKPWPKNATIARSAPYGPVTGPPAPKVDFLSTGRRQGRHVFVATVHCAVSCSIEVSVTVKHPGADGQSTWTAHEVITGTRTIGVSDTLPLGQVSGTLPSGRVTVTVQVGNGPYVTGRSLIH
jgi:hypothetical protein